MVHTVAILGANGQVGSRALPLLVKAHQEGKIKLIVLTRPGSKVNHLDDAQIEVREVDLEDPEDMDKALKGVNVLLITITMTAVSAQTGLIDAFKRSSDAITLIPSHFGAPWSEKDFDAYPGLGGIAGHLGESTKHAREIGLGVTQVENGGFHNYVFHYKTLGTDVPANKVMANEAQLRNPLPITNTEDLAAGLVDLVLRDPESIKNKKFSIVSHWATGNDLIDVFTKVHGTKPEVLDYDEAAKKATLEAKPVGPLLAGMKGHWEAGKEAWGFENPLPVSGGRSLEQTVRDSLREMGA